MFPLVKPLEKRDAPRRAVHRFIGGPLDGQSHEALEHYVLTDQVMITIDGALYQHAGEDTFEFRGLTHKAQPGKPGWKQKIINWLFS